MNYWAYQVCGTRHASRQSARPDQSNRLITLEQIETDAGGLAAGAGKPAVAVEEKLGIACCNRRELLDQFRSGYTELNLARLASAEDLAGTAQAQIFLCDAEAVVRFAHQG